MNEKKPKNTVTEDDFWYKISKKGERKKPSRLKRILGWVGFAFLSIIVVFVAIGVLARSQPAETSKTAHPIPSSCKYSEMNSSNILALINAYRASQKLPAIAESVGLSKYQLALLLEVQKNKEIKDKDLVDISAWQEKNIDKESITYVETGFKELSVSNFSNPCVAVDFLKSQKGVDLSISDHDVAGVAISGQDMIVLIAKKSSKASYLATADLNYLNNLREQSAAVQNQINDSQAELDAKDELENRYKEFLSQITIAIASDNLKNGSKPSSVSCSKAGSATFSYIGGKISSASTSHGLVSISVIGDKLSSIRGLETYSCNYAGDNISSCSGLSGSLSISNIGGQINSMSNYLSNVMSHYSYIGNNISSASEADLGFCNIN